MGSNIISTTTVRIIQRLMGSIIRVLARVEEKRECSSSCSSSVGTSMDLIGGVYYQP